MFSRLPSGIRNDQTRYTGWSLSFSYPVAHLVLVAMDVMLELFDDEFLVIDHTFHHVANRHDADYSIVFEHWKMAHCLRSHDGHAFLH
jgi:hypothetical protein